MIGWDMVCAFFDVVVLCLVIFGGSMILFVFFSIAPNIAELAVEDYGGRPDLVISCERDLLVKILKYGTSSTVLNVDAAVPLVEFVDFFE